MAIDDNEFDLNLLFRHYIRCYTNYSKIADNRCGKTLEYTIENDRFTDSSISSNESDDKPATTEIFEDYLLPDYESFQNQPGSEAINTQFLWILLWIMNFWTRFNIIETATEVLVKFMKLVLCEIGGNN